MDSHKVKLYDSNHTYYNITANGIGYSEALKLSNLHNVEVIGFNLIGGYEDCVDCVRGSNLSFTDGYLYNGDARVFVTAKGGIDGFVLKDVLLLGRPKWWDISLGDHTIYNDAGDNGIMKNVVIDNVSADTNRKVTVLCLWCERPELKNGNYRLIMVPKFLVKILFWYRKTVNKIMNNLKLSDIEIAHGKAEGEEIPDEPVEKIEKKS